MLYRCWRVRTSKAVMEHILWRAADQAGLLVANLRLAQLSVSTINGCSTIRRVASFDSAERQGDWLFAFSASSQNLLAPGRLCSPHYSGVAGKLTHRPKSTASLAHCASAHYRLKCSFSCLQRQTSPAGQSSCLSMSERKSWLTATHQQSECRHSNNETFSHSWTPI